MLSILWGFEFLALRAYEEDLGARKLYTNAGYQVVSRDPPWTSPALTIITEEFAYFTWDYRKHNN
ncbi:hypothetical protein JHK87_022188 [Glycine soja]|nr:hypothetical protein JHK87_022188 [Glycine soja]